MSDRKTIARSYLSGWFTVDLVAIVPFDHLMQAFDLNQLFRMTRIGRMYKLIKLTRLLRIFKLIKEQGKFKKLFSEQL